MFVVLFYSGLESSVYMALGEGASPVAADGVFRVGAARESRADARQLSCFFTDLRRGSFFPPVLAQTKGKENGLTSHPNTHSSQCRKKRWDCNLQVFQPKYQASKQALKYRL